MRIARRLEGAPDWIQRLRRACSIVAEAADVGEVAVAGLREPGRHESGLGDVEHLRGPAAGVGVGEEAEGASAAGVVAGGAVGVEERGYVVCPGFLRRRGGGLPGGGGCGGLGGGRGAAEDKDESGCEREQGKEAEGLHFCRNTMEQPTGGPAG